MTDGVYRYIRNAWMNLPREVVQSRLIQWRAGNSIEEVEKPLRLDRARALGYKAKKGFFVVRVRMKRGGRQRKRHDHGRKSRKQHVRKILKMSHQWIAEIRAARKYSNLEVLNSYPIGKDGKFCFFEVIMVDFQRPEIKNDRTINWIEFNRKRAERGLTSAGKKSRGLSTKSHDMKVRPSLRAWNRRGK